MKQETKWDFYARLSLTVTGNYLRVNCLATVVILETNVIGGFRCQDYSDQLGLF